MSELISRQKLIEAVKKEYYQFIDDDTDLAYNRAISDVIKVIESQPPADSGTDICVGTNQWIPCSERLPDDSGKWCYSMNLVTIENGDVCLGVYCENEGTWRTRMSQGETVYTTQHEVLAWMPLPEPYKGGINYD